MENKRKIIRLYLINEKNGGKKNKKFIFKINKLFLFIT